MGIRQAAGNLNRAVDQVEARKKPARKALFWLLVTTPFAVGWLYFGSPITEICRMVAGLTAIPLGLNVSRVIGDRTSTIKTDIYGGARNATRRELADAQMVGTKRGETRPYLGTYVAVKRDKQGKMQRTYTGRIVRAGPIAYETSTLVIGPSGCGKTLGLVAPNTLLDLSAVVADPSGQITCMAWRKGDIVLNPHAHLVYDKHGNEIRPHLKSARYNPLFKIPAPTGGQNSAADDAYVQLSTSLGRGMIYRTYGENDPHWKDSATGTCIGLVLWECADKPPADRSFRNIRKIITGGAEAIRSIYKKAKSYNLEEVTDKLARFAAEDITPETRSICSHLMTATEFLDEAPYVRDLSGANSFSWGELKMTRKRVFMVLPPDHLTSDAGGKFWLRMIVQEAITGLLRAPNDETQPRVLVILDEFPALGWLSSVKAAVNLVRKHKVNFMFFAQNLPQLSGTYGPKDWQEIESACGTKICFRPRDKETADHFSALAGHRTETIRSENMHHSVPGDTYQFRPDKIEHYSRYDIMTLPNKTAIALLADLPGIPIEIHAEGAYKAAWGRRMTDNPYT